MTDSDLSGLVVKTAKAATLLGVVVIEGIDEKLASKKLAQMYVSARVSASDAYAEQDEMHDVYGGFGVHIKPDGSFRLSGLPGGIANISVGSIGRSNSQDLALVRVERDGVVQPNGISVKEGEHIQGLRLVVRELTGAIRGQVKIEGGDLPRSTHMFVSITLIGETPPRSYRSEQVDSRGRFYSQGLAAGRYEVKVNAFGRGVLSNANESRQQITVADNTVTEVVLTLKLKTNPNQ